MIERHNLEKMLQENRKKRIEEVLQQRTRQICGLIEGVHDPHNISAVLRSAEAYGIQDCYILPNEENPELKLNKNVASSAQRWLSIHQFSDEKIAKKRSDCLKTLKSKNYKILAFTPHQSNFSLDDINPHEKYALCFGNEKDGLTPSLIEAADYRVALPMRGFVESFNISVCAAISFEIASTIIRSKNNWPLSEEEKEQLRFEWIKKSINQFNKLQEIYERTQEPSSNVKDA